MNSDARPDFVCAPEVYFIYFALAPDEDVLKVGITYMKVYERLKHIEGQRYGGKRMRVLYAIPVLEKTDERFFVHKFWHARIGSDNEYFDYKKVDVEAAIVEYFHYHWEDYKKRVHLIRLARERAGKITELQPDEPEF